MSIAKPECSNKYQPKIQMRYSSRAMFFRPIRLTDYTCYMQPLFSQTMIATNNKLYMYDLSHMGGSRTH